MARFPVDVKVPAYDAGGGQRQFSWNRGNRLHAGCDLYAPLGTPVRAIAAGKLVYTSTTFTNATKTEVSTGAVAVHHPSLRVVVRYAEILIPSELADHQREIAKGLAAAGLPVPKGEVTAPGFGIGDAIEEGDVLGYIGKVASVANTMLHFELYDERARDGVFRGGGPYARVDSLLDPTDFLMSLERGGPVAPGRAPSGERSFGVPKKLVRLTKSGLSRTVFDRRRTDA